MTDRVPRQTPAEMSDGWPDQPAADPAAEAARRFALNSRDALGDRSVRAVAREADVNEGAIRRVLAGSVWTDLRTISQLEYALGVNLYPGVN